MTQAHKTPGAIVEFVDKMYRPPYAPYYDAYKGELFEVKDPNKHPGHMLVQNIKGGDPFLIHDDEVKTITKERRLRELAKESVINGVHPGLSPSEVPTLYK